jgi:hypothetical protein
MAQRPMEGRSIRRVRNGRAGRGVDGARVARLALPEHSNTACLQAVVIKTRVDMRAL